MEFFTKIGATEKLSAEIKEAINKFYEDNQETRHSNRVSPSNLGEECAAKLWYDRRWVSPPEKHDGRMVRLFQRGHDEEAKIVKMLRNAGWTVREIDPATGKQYSILDFNGHLKGKLDGIGSHPEFTNGVDILLEFKSYNTKRFSVITHKPLKTEDPKYYGQIVLYMMYYNLPACLFFPVNKNDDDIHPLVFTRDDKFAKELLNKADTIINSRVRPARIAESPAYWKCKSCRHIDVCHRNKPVLINCRSCENCYPTENGKFYCSRWDNVIPDEAIPQGCNYHKPVQ